MDCDNGLDMLSNDGILDVIPPSEYDPFEAKFCASLFWLVFHATEDGGLEDVPSQVTNPVQKLGRCNTFVVHPEIVQFLTKGEVYCMVCSRIFPGRVALAGHWSVIQTLSRNGIYVVDGSTDIAVTDSALEQTNPFNQGSHVALMDALMTAYSSQVVNIQSVVQAVRRFSTFSASRELPFDMEDALLLWVNKLGGAINSKYSKLTSSNSTRKLLRNREQERKIELHGSIGEETPAASAFIPVIDDLFKGLCDGRCLLAILLFYEPTVIKIEDICADRVLSAEDSIRNLDLFRNLCSQYFCTSVLSLKVEDILYGSPSLKVNLVVLLAEMFWKCEGSSKEISEIQRSKTSCSANGERVTNGHDENARSRSAPVSRNELVSGNPAIAGSRHRQFLDKDISLKIQNFVENVGSSVQDIPAGEKHSPEEDVMSLGEGANVEDTMNVGGVVVKLRKKVPRNVEPGGGHEALLSRRMKKSLCSQSQEDVSADTTPRTSDPEEQFDAKSDEVYPQQGDFSTEPKEPLYRIMGNDDDVDNVDLTSLKDTPHSFDLDLNLLSEAANPLDQLSPISETTEPGSLGNSLNGSVTSPRDPPISVDSSALRHQPVEKNRELGPDRFTPPFSRTPRKLSHENQSLTEESSAPRGSYVITGVTHTAESAVAAGIPIVEREPLRMSGALSGHARSDANRSSDTALLFRSSFAAGQTAEAGSEIASPKKTPTASSQSWRGEVNGSLEYATVSDQRYSSEEHRPERRNDSRFSTFTKEKTTDEHKTNAPTYSLKTVEKKSENDRNLLTFSKNSAGGNAVIGGNTVEDDLPGRKNEMSEPPITWFVHRKPEPSSLKEDISKNVETVDHTPQRTVLESSGKTTNWALAARDSEPVEKEATALKSAVPVPIKVPEKSQEVSVEESDFDLLISSTG